MALLGPQKAMKLFKSMMRTELKIMLQLLFEVCCDVMMCCEYGTDAVLCSDWSLLCAGMGLLYRVAREALQPFIHLAFHSAHKTKTPLAQTLGWVCLTPLAQTLGC